MEWSRNWFETSEIRDREEGGFKGVIREGVDLRKLSYMRIGGSAAVFIEPWAEEDAAHVLRVCREQGLPYYILGGGSNVLIQDGELEGVVIYLGAWKRVVRDDVRLIASAGASLPSLLRMAKDSKYSGLESLVGIPAQVGGAVAMNAGTVEGSTFDCLSSVRVVDENSEIRTIEKDAFQPRYRNGGLGDVLITTATFDLELAPQAEIQARMEEILRKRNQTQPVSERSCGCIFKNPEGDSAGRLIDAAGLKGMSVGDAEVSTKHANYFVNRGEATAAQMLELIDRVRTRVAEEHGVKLELELKLWGF